MKRINIFFVFKATEAQSPSKERAGNSVGENEKKKQFSSE